MLTIIFVLELAAGITGYILRNSTADLMMSTLKPTMDNYIKEKHVAVDWDNIQRNFGCCGLTGYDDWEKAINGTPMSCCPIPDGIIDTFVCNNETETLQKIGCIKTFGGFIENHATTLGLAGIILAVVQLFGLLFACLIARRIKSHRGY